MTYNLECPITGYKDTDLVTMAHGSGGENMQKLIKEMFANAFPKVQKDTDAAIIFCGREMAFTTDSFVVNPLFFPGGNIGLLSVYGTVNDLAMMGAMPLYMSVAFILEEGFSLKSLQEIVRSMAKAAENAGISIVTGDTKVVEKGCGNGIYINTTGIGMIISPIAPTPESVYVGNKIIVSGDIGRHGMAIMSLRNGLDSKYPIFSDSAPLNKMISTLYSHGIHPSCMRDATRGGVAAALNEIARARSFPIHISIEEEKVLVSDNVRKLAEILGLDPLQIANEGRFILFVRADQAEKAVTILRTFSEGENAAIIGKVVAEHAVGLVTTKTLFGGEKIIPMPSGEILPRM